MKKGQLYPVFLRTGAGEYEVAQARLLEIDGDEAILEVPATRIVMGVATSLGDLPEKEPVVERKFDGITTTGGDEGSEAIDQARAELEAEGIELDDDDYSEGTPSQRLTLRGEREVQSLKDMVLDNDV